MEKKMMKQMMMALLLAMMPFAASAQETHVVEDGRSREWAYRTFLPVR